MAIDLRRCGEAAARAALAEAFAPPEPRRERPRRRRFRPVRVVWVPVRTALVGVGLVTSVRIAVSPELRRAIIEAVAEHLPIEELLDELVLDADVVPDADDADHEAEEATDTDPAAAGNEHAPKRTAGTQRRRPVTRARGDTNGQRGRKPPNRGTRA